MLPKLLREPNPALLCFRFFVQICIRVFCITQDLLCIAKRFATYEVAFDNTIALLRRLLTLWLRSTNAVNSTRPEPADGTSVTSNATAATTFAPALFHFDRFCS